MEDDASDYSKAEQRLVDAIAAGAVCDFGDGAAITADEMASWGPERTIRATVLRHLLTAEDAQNGVLLRGAVIEGILDNKGISAVQVDLQHCQIATIEASGATFTGDASFAGTTFTGNASFALDARFTGATFTGDASFAGATFTRDASFSYATFTRDAHFGGATFTHYAHFGGASFTHNARFTGATFTGDANFSGATFTGDASFTGATFTGDAWFAVALFTGDAWFTGATFTGDAWFGDATFTHYARFTGATFTHDARFASAIADIYDFRGAQFHTTDPGPWVARQVTLTGAVFHVRARVAVAAVKTRCDRLQAREGVHLVVRGGAVNLEDAEFLRRSILAHSGSEPALPERNSPGERPERSDRLTLARQARWTAMGKAFQLAQQLADALGRQETTRTQVASLRRATAGDLVLSGVGLEDCAFAGAHGLDKLRIDATCSFQRPPAWPSRTWRLFTGRQVIFEEAQWRQGHTSGWASTSTTPTASAKPNDPLPTALAIAGIYRDLRKGLEDAKDEPGAADFYYGEMEMRRLAARGRGHRLNADGGTGGRRPSWTERRLLDIYWAVSGYGLRAWRALTALTILLVGCAALFTLPVFVKTHPDAAVTFPTSMEFTARESLTLIRTSGTPALQVTGAGTALDIALRLLAPLLLGLAVLAVRGRIKR